MSFLEREGKQSTFKTSSYYMGPLGALPLQTTTEDRIYRDLIEMADQRNLDDFEYLVNYSIPSILLGDYIVSPTLTRRVIKVEVHFPITYKKINQEKIKCLLTPALARMTKQNYTCPVVCHILDIDPTYNSLIAENRSEIIGSIPCPVGSCRCITSIKPPEIATLDEWKMMCQEDPSTPGGYFIKDGAKKIFLYGEKLNTNTFFTVEIDKDHPRAETRFTELFRAKTTVLKIRAGKKKASVKILPPHLSFSSKPKHYPLFLVIYLLLSGIQALNNFSIDTYIKLISEFAPKIEQKYVVAYLETSKVVFETKFVSEDQINRDAIMKYIQKKNKERVIGSAAFTPENISFLLIEEIFRSSDTIVNKIANLCAMACQHIRCSLKLRAYDSRDSWKNKKLDSPIRLIEQYVADYLTENIKTRRGDDGSWIIGRNDKQENIVESMKVDTIALIRSMYTKINAVVDSKTKSFSLRAVSQTQYGAVCPAKTAEGEKCGITKYISVCTKISNNSEHISNRLDVIFNTLNIQDYSSFEKSDECRYPIYFEYEGTLQPITVEYNPIYVSDKFYNSLKEYNPKANIELGESMILHVTSLDRPREIKMWNGAKISLGIDQQSRRLLAYGFSIINDFMAIITSPKYNFLFTYNGNFFILNKFLPENIAIPHLLYVNPNTIIPYLKNLRRNLQLPIDSCIYRNNIDLMVQYYDDSGRLMCPLLTADLNGNLILDSLDIGEWKGMELMNYNRSKERVQRLFETGAIEYIDSKEIGTIFIAETIQEFRRFANLRNFLNDINLNHSDSYIHQLPNGHFKNEDISYVRIGGKNYDIEFTTIPTEGAISVQSEVGTLYGEIILPYKLYTPVHDDIITIIRPETSQVQIRDGFYLGIFENNNLIWIPPNTLGINDTQYRGKRILNVRLKDHITSFIHVKIGEQDILKPNPYLYLKNEGYIYFIVVDGQIQWSNESIHNDIIYNEVNFEGLSEGYFSSVEKIGYSPLEEGMDYEHFDINKERILYDEKERKNTPNDRESDLLISYVRRNQKVLDILSKEANINYTFQIFRDQFPSFKKRSEVYKIMRYLNWRFKFTHAPIDPNIIYSAIANLVPKANHSQGPRFTYQCAMGTQALGLGNVMYYTVFETSLKRAIRSHQHFFETVAEETLSAVTMPTRENFVVAIYSHRKGFEDALVIARSVFGRYEYGITITIVEKIDEAGSELIGFPLDSKGNRRKEDRYRHLQDNGLPRLGSLIEVGDCIVGQSRINSSEGRKDISTIAKTGEDGEVIQIRVMSSEENKKKRFIRIKIAQRRFQLEGDKLAAAPAQKGTNGGFIGGEDNKGEALQFPKYEINSELVAGFMSNMVSDEKFIQDIASGKIKYKVIDDANMPRVRGGPNDGMAIHVLFSPFSFPSRMTLGLDFELLTGKSALRLQKKVDGTTFHDLDLPFYENILEANGIDRNGGEYLSHSDGEVMINATTGKPFKCFIGVTSYQILKHQVYDKRAIRTSKGRRDPVTRQPLGGRTIEGGQRFGEMESDALKSHGASGIMLDRMMYASDAYNAVYCQHCGNKSSNTDVTTNTCQICRTADSLVVMEHPRSFTVLSQSLAALGLNNKMTFPKK